MKELLAEDIVTEIFGSQLAHALRAPSAQELPTVLQVVSHFYLTTAIEGVDSTDAEADALLFEYGTYNWHDGRGERFTLSFIRQFQVAGEEEYYQLRCELAFAGDFAPGLSGRTCWSWDYSALPAWQTAVQETAGYQKALTSNALSLEIKLDQT